MSEIRFRCPSCSGKLTVDSAGAGMKVNCPKCAEPIRVPHSSTLAPKLSEAESGSPQEDLSSKFTEIQAAVDKALAEVASLQAELCKREREVSHQAESLKIQEATFDRVREKLEDALQERAMGEASEKVERKRMEQEVASLRSQQAEALSRKLGEERKRMTEAFEVKEQQMARQQEALAESCQKAELERDQLRSELEQLKAEQGHAREKEKVGKKISRRNVEASDKALAAILSRT